MRVSRSASGCFKDGVATNGACDGGKKLNDRLMRQTDRVFDDAAPENLRGNLLLFGKAVIEAVDQNVRVNESGHARRGPLSSNLDGAAVVPHALARVCGDVRSLRRTDGAVIPDLLAMPVRPPE